MSRVVKALRNAESEVARLEAAVVRWQGEAEEKRRELADLEASAGDRVLADETGTVARVLAVDAQELRFLIDGAQAAAQAAERQLLDARDDLTLAQAREKRDQAAKRQATLDAHRAKLAPLLEQLRQLDGVDYVPFRPSEDDIRAQFQQVGRVSWDVPKYTHLEGEIPALLAEADALEAPVLERRRIRDAAAQPLVPSARIDVPAWDDINSASTVTCSVSEGAGSATFEVLAFAFDGAREVVTLPDAQGRRAWSRRIRIQAGGGGAEVRCNGEVLAKESRPGRLVSNGLGSFWVELA